MHCILVLDVEDDFEISKIPGLCTVKKLGKNYSTGFGKKPTIVQW